MRRLGPANWATQPWKNGGGITHEVWRDASLTAEFAIRISCAEVSSSGPFSAFPGVDRTIVLASGEGFSIRRDNGEAVTLGSVGDCWHFRGDDAWDCHLVNGPVLDLNVMTERRTVRSEVETRRFAPSEVATVEAPTVIAFVLAGSGVRVASDGAVLELQPRDLVVGAGRFVVSASSAACVVSGRFWPSPRPARRVAAAVAGAYALAIVDVYRAPGTRFSHSTAETIWLVTACNPGAVRLGDEDNRTRMAALEAAVHARGIAYAPALGRSVDGSWQEPSLALVGCGVDAALALAETFDQDAIYELAPGRPPLVVWCHGAEP